MIISELQRSMKQLKESQLAQRERYRRMNWNINELFERGDQQFMTQHTQKKSIAALKARVPSAKERFAEIIAPKYPEMSPRTMSVIHGTTEGSIPNSNLYRHIEEKSEITNQKIDKLLNIVNTSFARLESISQQRFESASSAYRTNSLNVTPQPF